MGVDDIRGCGPSEQLPDPATGGGIEGGDLDRAEQPGEVGLTGAVAPHLRDDRTAGPHGYPLVL